MRFARFPIALFVVSLFSSATSAFAASLDSMVQLKSAHSVEETIEKAEAFVEE